VMISARRYAYRVGILKTKQFPVPVIVIGNITVGGTGKTPCVVALSHALKQNGWKPGIVSRGYAGSAKEYPLRVFPDSNPKEAGDEAVLLALDSGCPVIVDPVRTRAVETLLKETDCDVILSDDGLQHYALGRSIEIALVDAERELGNRHLLPAGPLREPPSRLKDVDYVVYHGAATSVYTLTLIPSHWVNCADPNQTLPLMHFSEKTVHAIAAIGNPERYFHSLRQLGINIIPHPFPDHHPFTLDELKFTPLHPIVMTSKDAVKCRYFATQTMYYLAVRPQLSEGFLDAIQGRLSEK
jgi:tetraacyldisaccharide 4'-kinase